MLFRKKLPRSCEYCAYGTKMDDSQVICMKKGVVPCDRNCRKFTYDPCKRVPVKAKALDFSKYEDTDFSL